MCKESSNRTTLMNWAFTLAIPAAITISSYIVSTSIERSKVSSEYVKLATTILSTKYSDSEDVRAEQEALKGWAIRVLDNRSPVKMTDSEKEAFISDVNLDSLLSRLSYEGDRMALSAVFEGLASEVSESQKDSSMEKSDD